MENPELLERKGLLEGELEVCRRKEEARRKFLGLWALEEEESWKHAENMKEASKHGCSSLEEFKVQREELKALKQECRRMWLEQEKGEEECRTMWKEVYTNFTEKWKAEKKVADPDAVQM